MQKQHAGAVVNRQQRPTSWQASFLVGLDLNFPFNAHERNTINLFFTSYVNDHTQPFPGCQTIKHDPPSRLTVSMDQSKRSQPGQV